MGGAERKSVGPNPCTRRECPILGKETFVPRCLGNLILTIFGLSESPLSNKNASLQGALLYFIAGLYESLF